MPLTEALIGVNVIVFVAMVASGVPWFLPSPEQLIPWGANTGPLSLGSQPWRILTSNYLHYGILHLAVNMWCLWNLGKLGERLLGRLTLLATYTVCGIAGSIATLWLHRMGVGAGASGAIFGLAGTLITAIYLGKLPYPPSRLRSIGRSLLGFAGYNLLIGLFIPFVDNTAHVGGLVAGLLLGACLAPWLSKPTPVRRRAERILFAAAALILLGAGTLVRRANGFVVPLTRAQAELTSAQTGSAIRDLEAVARKRPDDAEVLRRLGIAYLQKNEFAKAESVFDRVARLRPDDLSAKYNLGVVYGSTGRFEQARQIFAELTHLDPANEDFWLQLALSLKELKRPQEAERALQQALHVNPDNYQAHSDLGWVQLDLNQPDAALGSFQRAAQLEPSDADSQLGLSRAYAAKKMDKESAEALRRYVILHAATTAGGK